MKHLIRKNIQSLKAYSSARDEFSGKEGIFLDANENPFGVLNRYPDPYQKALKERLTEIKKIPAEQIFIGNGSDEVIDLVFRLFCEPKMDKALTFAPTYGMYQVSADINDVKLDTISLNFDFQIDKNQFLKKISEGDYKLLIVCSPNNPTANALNDLEFLLENFKGMVLIDEAYIDFCPEKTSVPLLKKYPNLIIAQTMSKAWGLAAIRVGIALTSVEIVNWLNKIKPPYNVSVLNQKAALEALQNEEEFEQRRATIIREREKMLEELSSLEIVKNIYPSDANFILVEVSDANQIYNQLVEKNVILRNRHSLINNCLRITIGTPEENKTLIDSVRLIMD